MGVRVDVPPHLLVRRHAGVRTAGDVDARLRVGGAALRPLGPERVRAAHHQRLAGVGEREAVLARPRRPDGRVARRRQLAAVDEELPVGRVEQVLPEVGGLEVDLLPAKAVAAVGHGVAVLRVLEPLLHDADMREGRVLHPPLDRHRRPGAGAGQERARVADVLAGLAGAGDGVLGLRVVVVVRRGARWVDVRSGLEGPLLPRVHLRLQRAVALALRVRRQGHRADDQACRQQGRAHQAPHGAPRVSLPLHLVRNGRRAQTSRITQVASRRRAGC